MRTAFSFWPKVRRPYNDNRPSMVPRDIMPATLRTIVRKNVSPYLFVFLAHIIAWRRILAMAPKHVPVGSL